MQVFTDRQREQLPYSCTKLEYEEALHSVTVVRHPIVADGIRVLRNRETKKVKFGDYADRVGQVLLLEALCDMHLVDVEVETPLEHPDGGQVKTPCQKFEVDDGVCYIVVLRAGLALWQNVLPKSPVGTYDIERDEKTAEPIVHRIKLPHGIASMTPIIGEPMLATAGTTAFVVEDLERRGCRGIRIVSIFAAAKGVLRLKRKHPDVEIYVGALDPGLNEKSFIVPGCGDFGDRYMGTVEPEVTEADPPETT